MAPVIKLAIVDDHTLFRKGLISLLERAVHQPFELLFEANDGLEMMDKMTSGALPDVVIMDVNMPRMSGLESVSWLSEHHLGVRVLVVSMIEKEETIIKMLQLGVKGYLSKDVEPKELGEAITAIINKGYYYTDFITGRLIHSLQQKDREEVASSLEILSDREKEFLRLACSEHTYSEIASMMYVSPKTVDGYRKALFDKLSVKNRVGLALYAIKNGFITL
jgi:DNA-binding NarL/FixJ family response regulator